MAMKQIALPRFFKSERGYQGIFYCKLYKEFKKCGIVNEDCIIEMEYQKSARHRIYQRPDIILHIPVEHSGAVPTDNNFAVWALKARANKAAALEDFEKLNQMFTYLNYEIGFFVNIGNDFHHLNNYNGKFQDRLICFAVKLQNGNAIIKQAYFNNHDLIERNIL